MMDLIQVVIGLLMMATVPTDNHSYGNVDDRLDDATNRFNCDGLPGTSTSTLVPGTTHHGSMS